MKRIGIGVDFQHFNQYRVSGEDLINSLRPRLSHVSVVALENPKQTDDFMRTTKELPVIHHLSGVEPAGLNGIDWKNFDRQNQLSRRMNAVWCGEDIGIWSIGPYAIPYFTPPVFCREVLDQTVEQIKTLQLKSVVPFLAEIPSCTLYVGDIPVGDFFKELCDRSGCGIVLDISHVFSFASYFEKDTIEMLNSFPLDRAVEAHIAGGSLHPEHKYRYRDTHSEPVMEPVFEIYQHALQKCRALRAITYEIGVGLAPEVLHADFDRIEAVAAKNLFEPRLNATADHATLAP